MWAQSLHWKDPLEKEMATHSRILTWRVPRTEEPGGLQSVRSQRVGHDWTTEHANTHAQSLERHSEVCSEENSKGKCEISRGGPHRGCYTFKHSGRWSNPSIGRHKWGHQDALQKAQASETKDEDEQDYYLISVYSLQERKGWKCN